MKKTVNARVRNLIVNRETLRLLSEKDMRPVIGGLHETNPCPSVEEDCGSSQSPTCQ
jgi:hypothetical protein